MRETILSGLLIGALLLYPFSIHPASNDCGRWGLFGIQLGMTLSEVREVLRQYSVRIEEKSFSHWHVIDEPELDIYLKFSGVPDTNPSATIVSVQVTWDTMKRFKLLRPAAMIEVMSKRFGVPTRLVCYLKKNYASAAWGDQFCSVFIQFEAGYTGGVLGALPARELRGSVTLGKLGLVGQGDGGKSCSGGKVYEHQLDQLSIERLFFPRLPVASDQEALPGPHTAP